MTPKRSDLDDAWSRVVNDDDPKAKEEILIAYRPLVERIAREVLRKKPSNFDRDDLIQAGMIGLLNAIERFDPSREVLFSTFATIRVRGSIYDEINKMDWTPRQVRERIRAVIKAKEDHYRVHQHTPSADELSQIIKDNSGKELSPQEVLQAEEQASKTYVHAVDNSTVIHQEEVNTCFVSATNQRNGVEEKIELDEFRSAVNAIIDSTCDDFEAAVIRAVYFDEKSMKALSEELGIPVSRVSSAKRSAIIKIENAARDHGMDEI